MSTTDKKTRMTPNLWAQAESLYESGEYTLEGIAEKFDVHVATVQRHMKKNGINRGARAEAIKEKVSQKIAEVVAEEVDIQTRRVQETKEEHYRINQAIDKRVAREIILAEQEGRSIATAFPVFKALKLAAEVVKITRDNRYSILGIDNENGEDDELPSLEVREMLDEEIAAIRDAQSKQASEMGLSEDD